MQVVQIKTETQTPCMDTRRLALSFQRAGSFQFLHIMGLQQILLK